MRSLTTLLFVLCCFAAASLHAQNAVLTIQGILKKSDGSAVPDDAYSLKIALYDAAVGGTKVWEDPSVEVETTGGVYSALIGEDVPLTALFDQPYYLSVKIGSSSQELLPRPRLSAAPYALAIRGQDNVIPSTGNITVYGMNAAANISVGGASNLTGTVECSNGILVNTGALSNAGSPPFSGYGFKGDGGTGYGSNQYGVANIWANGVNVITATANEVTINKFLKLPNAASKTYTTSDGERAFFAQMYLGANLASTPITQTNFPVTNTYSLDASGLIKCGALQTVSDRRIKKNFTLSNKANDLALLQQIKVTDYQYKDVIGKGATWKKGVIAQEVEALIPEAIGLSTDVIPDIYALAKSAQMEARTLHLTMEQAHGLKPGDKVRLMAGDHQEDLLVQATPSAMTFSVTNWQHGAPEKVFVYGHEVNDFHAVDYDYLFMTNISATQELARRVESLEKENASFKSENTELRQLLEGLRADVEALKGQR